DTLFEQVSPDDEADVDRMVAKANALLRGFKWLPLPFNAILDGKNHLPKGKLRLTLFNKEDGFMGNGAYKEHFFGEMTMLDLLSQGARDQIRYARPLLKWRRKKQARLSWGK
ncbi:MAG: NAD(P)/FAD-dependent oxidoreductase, partial [Anaerolineae bacterium]|nr:NAD(P)/FAD-dependent oxidoreductase [Anaerolineae bacterium]